MEWSCQKCTFLNPASCTRCEMCLEGRKGIFENEPILISDTESEKDCNNSVNRGFCNINLRLASPLKQSNSNNNTNDSMLSYSGRVLVTETSGSDKLFRDLVNTKDLQKAFLSAYCVDDEWVDSIFSKVKTCIARPKHSDAPPQITFFKRNQNTSYVFPPMVSSFGCMHVKLMLLWYPNYLRVVVPSANLVLSF